MDRILPDSSMMIGETTKQRVSNYVLKDGDVESGDWEVYITTYPGANGKSQVSRAGGTEPRWRGDSKAVYYIAPKQVLTEATASTEGVFSSIGTRPLYPIRARYP